MATVSDRMDDNTELTEALVNLFESLEAADGDFCGEQREWHLPRLQRCSTLMLKLFPCHCVRAIEQAKSPYDTPTSA